MAAYYPSKPSEKQKILMTNFFEAIGEFYPCPTCAEDFREKIKMFPPKVGNNQELSVWLCDRHNEVNVKLGKPKFSCDKVWERWGNDEDHGCGKVCDDVLGADKVKMMNDLLKK